MFDLTGRTALVTGASGGIGGAIAQALHRQGATVTISGTRREALDTLAGQLGGQRIQRLAPCAGNSHRGALPVQSLGDRPARSEEHTSELQSL